MYILNNAVILPACNIGVEICLYIITALLLSHLLFYPALTFLHLVFLHKYLSNRTRPLLEAVLLLH